MNLMNQIVAMEQRILEARRVVEGLEAELERLYAEHTNVVKPFAAKVADCYGVAFRAIDEGRTIDESLTNPQSELVVLDAALDAKTVNVVAYRHFYGIDITLVFADGTTHQVIDVRSFAATHDDLYEAVQAVLDGRAQVIGEQGMRKIDRNANGHFSAFDAALDPKALTTAERRMFNGMDIKEVFGVGGDDHA